MRISTKGRYGLRALVDMAMNPVGQHVALYSIAERQDISESYLEQVFAALRKAGIVKSIKGAQGGYVLAESSSKITVGKILRILEGDPTVINESEDLSDKKNIDYCIKLNVWDKMNEALSKVADSITLEDLVSNYKELNGSLSMMFYI
ncbi:MAG: Rrf2 family transcriptional regulator [Clostridia bacterium]|jgi:Rrf2 family protein